MPKTANRKLSHIDTAVFVAGPTASGKTTLVKSLSKIGALYTENAQKNPYLSERVEDLPFDALASQRWFLDKITNFLENTSNTIAIIDQHPFGVNIYSQLFHERGLINTKNFEEIESEATSILCDLQRSGVQVLTVLLSASTDNLWERICKREFDSGLTIEEVRNVNRLFQGLVLSGPTMFFNTEVIDVETEKKILTDWIKKNINYQQSNSGEIIMTLKDILSENWSSWSEGGLTEELLENKMPPKTIEFLQKWIDASFQRNTYQKPNLTLKAIVDIATWCLYGTHEFIYVSREIREKKIEKACKRFRLNPKILSDLILHVADLHHI
jgi:deoxyadenosine/deoxycytidine kinase